MSTEISQLDYSFEGEEVRVVMDAQDEPWFVLADLCNILDRSNPTAVSGRLDEDEKGLRKIETLGGVQQMLCVTEPGFWSVVQRSSSPKAKPIQRWANHEVFPSIRRHGVYATPATVEAMLADPDTMIRTLQALKIEREARESLQAKVDADASKVLLAEAVMVSADCVTIARLSNILKANGDDIGEKRLFERMRSEGYLCKEQGKDWNRPTQRALDLGVLVPRETTWFDRESNPHLSVTPYVTGKGQKYFVNKYCGKKEAVA